MLKFASIALAFLLSANTLVVPAGDDPLFDEGRSLISAGKLDEAKIAVTGGLSISPYSTEGYQLMYSIAKKEASPEEQLRWGKWLAWSYTASGDKDALATISEELTEIYIDWNADNLILAEWQGEAAKAASKAGSGKQYRLAGHLLSKLLDINPRDKKLNKSWDKLASDAGNEVSGGAFVSDKVRRKSPAWLEKNNARHSDWENRWQRKTKYYEINTNLDYEFFETVCAAMTQMNEFYRSVYDYGRKKAKHVTLQIGAKRSDFDRFSMELLGRAIQSESVGGYWVSTRSTVAAFDRSMGDPNKTKDDLWNTLFHEASHQFMSIKMEKNERRGIYTPAWLDEGTASYFEGCVITANGTILKNNVAESRLRSWWSLERNDSTRHTLEELIAHPRNTGPLNGTLSYEGDFYPYGWALVYFLLNYEENDRRVYAPPITPGEAIPSDYKAVRKAGKLVYRDPYLKYIEYFSKKGNVDNDQFMPLEMAKQFFVDEVADPDVPNWEAFEVRWRKFTNSLYGEMLSGPEFADVLQARSRGYILAGDYERARVTAEQADNKRPFDAETYRLLAEANIGEGLEGDALFWMFRHWETVWEAGDLDATATAELWLKDNGGKSLLKSYIEPTKLSRTKIEAAMEAALEDGHPICGPLFATHAMQAWQIDFDSVKEQAKELSELADQDLRAWQSAYAKTEASNRKDTIDNGNLIDVVKYEKDGVLIFNPDGWASAGQERTNATNLMNLSPPFSLRGELTIDGDAALFFFGIGRSGKAQTRVVIATSGNGDQVIEFQRMSYSVNAQRGEASLRNQVTGGAAFEKEDTVKLQFDFDSEGKGTYTVNGQSQDIPEGFTASQITGGFAITASEDTAVLFKNIAVRPSSAFWPVSPASDDE
ncbi:MAG: hypothetical protein ACI84O_000261 [Myxococcota bacterium]|jgi:hypothetical protein